MCDKCVRFECELIEFALRFLWIVFRNLSRKNLQKYPTNHVTNVWLSCLPLGERKCIFLATRRHGGLLLAHKKKELLSRRNWIVQQSVTNNWSWVNNCNLIARADLNGGSRSWKNFFDLSLNGDLRLSNIHFEEAQARESHLASNWH